MQHPGDVQQKSSLTQNVRPDCCGGRCCPKARRCSRVACAAASVAWHGKQGGRAACAPHNDTRPRFHKLPVRSRPQDNRGAGSYLGPTRAVPRVPGMCEREGRRSRGPRESGARPRALGRRDFPPPVRSTARPRRRLPSPSRWPAPHMQSRRPSPSGSVLAHMRLQLSGHSGSGDKQLFRGEQKKPIIETRAGLSFSHASCLFYYVLLL